MTHLKRVIASLAIVLVSCLPSLADTILTVTVIRSGQADQRTEFSREDLQALGMTTLRTTNDYIDGPADFEGPLMRDLIAYVGGENAKIARMIASNDYTVEIPMEEFWEYKVILALQQDGKQLSLRDKGLIWLMYPMSQYAKLQDPAFNNRLIWQLDRVAFE